MTCRKAILFLLAVTTLLSFSAVSSVKTPDETASRRYLESNTYIDNSQKSESSTLFSHGHLKIQQNKPLRVEYMFEKPVSSVEIKGVYFLAHGCVHHVQDWFERSEHCMECLGLPVERKIVKYLTSKGYVALSASNQHRCWTKHDIEPTIQVIQEVYSNLSYSFHDKPLYLLGASSGGAFVGMLSNYLRTNNVGFQASGIIPQIMPITNAVSDISFPPVAYIYMERDQLTKTNIEREMATLTAKNILNRSFSVAPRVVNDDYFSSFGGNITLTESTKLVKAFRANGIITSDGMVSEDPRGITTWRHVSYLFRFYDFMT